MFEYQKTGSFFAQCPGKLEDYAARELKEFGVKDLKITYRGVYFKTDLDHIYRINYRSRLLSRVLAPLLTFDCHSDRYLLKTAKTIEWDKLLTPDNTFAIFSNVSNSKITHSYYATQVLKDAISDYFRKKHGKRPSVDKDDPDIWINLYIHDNKAKISLDTSGGALHKRGYRLKSVKAPMQETLAAAIVRVSGWKGDTKLYDPFCGSGTILSEALLHYCRLPSALNREKFGFQALPEFDKDNWLKIVEDAKRLKQDLPKDLLYASDIDQSACWAAEKNFLSLPDGDKINLRRKNFRDLDNLENSTIITNPPYGIRMESESKAAKTYGDFGDFLKQKCKGSTAFIYFGNKELIGSLGLKPSLKIPMVNGNLDGRLVKVEIY